jgi:hypothetical protein
MSPDAKYPWSVLGLEKMPLEVKDIRRAYARGLKQIDQANDIEGFSALRAAYENAVAIREGRDRHNDYNRARKAETIAAAKVTQAEPQPADATAPVRTPPDAMYTPPAARQSSPNESAKQARLAATEALLAALDTVSIVMSGGERISQALDSPLIRDPDYADRIRYAIADVIRSRFKRVEWDSTLSVQIDQATLLRLDKTYGWLSDFGAFRRDFWNNNDLLDAMATRAFGSIKLPTPPKLPPKTRMARAWPWANTHATALTLGYIGVIVATGMTLPDGALGALLAQGLLLMVLLPVAAAVFGFTYIVFNAAFLMLRAAWRTASDTALRFKPKK